MNVVDVLAYGHAEVERAVRAFPAAHWDEPGVAGTWSGKDVVGHLGAFERVLVEVVGMLAGDEGPTPYVDAFTGPDFNDRQAAARAEWSLDDVLAEYREAYEAVMERVGDLDRAFLREPGTMPWYGDAYSFDDLVAYAYYGHKREHVAQLAMFADRVK